MPPASVIALLSGGLAACGVASALVAALLFPVLGAGLIASTVLGVASCVYIHVWARNNRNPPRRWHWLVIFAGSLGVAVGLVSGFRSADGFRGFSVAWLSCCAIAATAAARPLASSPFVVLSPTLLPVYRWDDASSRVQHSTWAALTLAGCAAAVFAWSAVAASVLNPPSGGAAASLATLVLSFIAAGAALNAERSAAAAALDSISDEGLALAVAQAGRAVGLVADSGAAGSADAAGAVIAGPAAAPEHVAVAVAGEGGDGDDPSPPLPDPVRVAEDAAAESLRAVGLVCGFAVPPEDSDGVEAGRKACASALEAQATAAQENLRLFRFCATLSVLVRRTAEAEQSAEDAALRAFLLSLGLQATAGVRWTAKERERIAVARAAYVEQKRKEQEENERREREAEEARRRRAAAAAAAAKRAREQSLGIVTCQEAAEELKKRTQGRGAGSFADPAFPAGLRALYANGKSPQDGHDPIHESVRSWKRCSELASGGRACLFAPEAEQADRVLQGALGDCWAISAIAVLASQGLVKPLFMSEFNDEGAYCVRFFRDGVWEPIVIDDSLPTGYGGPAFCKSKDGSEFWPSLLEKAYAKFYGGYEELEGGWISDALGAHGRVASPRRTRAFMTVNGCGC